MRKFLLFLPLYALLLAAGAALVVLLLFTASRLDAQYRQEGLRVAEAALRSLRWDVERTAREQAREGELARALFERYDAEALAKAFPRPRLEELRLGATAAIDARTVLVAASGLAPPALAEMNPDNQSLGLLAGKASQEAAKAGLAASSLLSLGGAPYLAGIARFSGADSYFMALRPLDGAALAELSANYPLKGLALAADPPATQDRGFLPLADPSGYRLGYLVWESEAPGRSFLGWVALPMAGVLLSMGAGSLAVGMRISQSMRQAEQASRELARRHRALEEAVAARRALLGGMSRDLGPPLAAILGFSDILRRELFGPLGSATYSGHAINIHGAAQNLSLQVERLIDLERIEGGNFGLFYEKIDPATLAREAAESVQGILRQTGRPLESNLPDGLPLITCDKRTTVRALAYLLANTARRADEKAKLRLSIWTEHSEVALAVASSARPPDPASPEEAAGLGLSLCRRLLELQGGRMIVHPDERGDTVCELRLPRPSNA
jgi:signal transduction histidine kinase